MSKPNFIRALGLRPPTARELDPVMQDMRYRLYVRAVQPAAKRQMPLPPRAKPAMRGGRS